MESPARDSSLFLKKHANGEGRGAIEIGAWHTREENVCSTAEEEEKGDDSNNRVI